MLFQRLIGRRRGGDTAALVDRFITVKRVARRSPKTVARYNTVLGRLAVEYPELPADVATIGRFLGNDRWCAETVDTYFRTLRTFYRWAEHNSRVANPIAELQAPALKPTVPVTLEIEEIGRLLLHPSHSLRDRSLLYFLTDTAARIGEAANLTRLDIRDSYVKLRGKTGERLVPITPITRRMLDSVYAIHGSADAIWVGRRGPLTTSGLIQLVRRAFRRAGFSGPRSSAHTLRHTFGTFWDGDETILQEILGHTTLDTVKRYRKFRLARAQAQHVIHSPVASFKYGAGQLALW